MAGQGAIFDTVTNFMSDPKADPQAVVKKLYSGIQSAK